MRLRHQVAALLCGISLFASPIAFAGEPAPQPDQAGKTHEVLKNGRTNEVLKTKVGKAALKTRVSKATHVKKTHVAPAPTPSPQTK